MKKELEFVHAKIENENAKELPVRIHRAENDTGTKSTFPISEVAKSLSEVMSLMQKINKKVEDSENNKKKF